MFTIALEIIFSIFVVSLLIYLSGLKEKFGELTQTGWNKLSTGLIFVLLAGLSGLLEELEEGAGTRRDPLCRPRER